VQAWSGEPAAETVRRIADVPLRARAQHVRAILRLHFFSFLSLCCKFLLDRNEILHEDRNGSRINVGVKMKTVDASESLLRTLYSESAYFRRSLAHQAAVAMSLEFSDLILQSCQHGGQLRVPFVLIC